ncbi:fluoride efflux transporter FluC [Zhihengliuella flava]|uniref:Fluoride-specific ion channel n=1 Tax=Zhihengliuella flava TaxID=1285193 RepID=A0A931GKN5_9MICC|nr:CrcB family protein [Zhihengliuella flava]MBG6083674.1 CrcB protein [Zhihengliuella flava]
MSNHQLRMTWPVVAAVAAAGFVGTLLRYGLSHLLGDAARPVVEAGHVQWDTLPWGTVLVNVVGCLALGWVTGWWVAAGITHGGRRRLRLAVTGGLLGSFTSFSAIAVITPGVALSGAELSDTGLSIIWTLGAALACCGAAAAGLLGGRWSHGGSRPHHDPAEPRS